MRYIPLNNDPVNGTVIMIFAEGTILRPHSWLTLYCHNSYEPIGKAAQTISEWTSKGYSVIYCTSRKGKQADNMAKLLEKYSFPGTYLVCREKGDKYKDLVEKIKPDILIEDNCKSIGGAWQMCITHVDPEIRKDIRSIVVGEFKGIDNIKLC